MLLYFEDEAAPAVRLAEAAGMQATLVECHRFPDGELKLRLPTPLPERVVVFRGLHQPNEKLVALLLAARTARELGARDLTLVTPYLGYMRQDMAFRPGEAVSQRIVGAFWRACSMRSSPWTRTCTAWPHWVRRCPWRGPWCSAVRPHWLTGSLSNARAPCCWDLTKKPHSGWPRPPHGMATTVPCAARCATVTGMWKSNCLT